MDFYKCAELDIVPQMEKGREERQEVSSLYPFQRRAVDELLAGKHIIYASCGAGKNPMSMVWAAEKCKATGKDKILVITTASKARTTDHWDDLNLFCPSFSKSLSSFSLLSWHKLSAWVNANWSSLDEWVVVADEIQRCCGGVSSQMGKAFLKLTKRNHDWARDK